VGTECGGDVCSAGTLNGRVSAGDDIARHGGLSPSLSRYSLPCGSLLFSLVLVKVKAVIPLRVGRVDSS
jgi:hypothetical protein